MSKTAKIWSVVAATAALLIVGVTIYVWFSGQSARKIARLRSQLAQEDLSPSERNALKTQLMRTVDEMDRDQLRAMSASVREQRRQISAQRIRDFHAASESEKLAVLDEAIDQMAAERDFNSAFNGGRRRGGRRPNRGATNRGGNQLERGDQTGRGRERNAAGQGGAAGEQRRGGDQRRRGDAELSEEQQRQRTEYFEALKARAEERGVEIGDGRGRERR
jgi:hypothetical protein